VTTTAKAAENVVTVARRIKSMLESVPFQPPEYAQDMMMRTLSDAMNILDPTGQCWNWDLLYAYMAEAFEEGLRDMTSPPVPLGKDKARELIRAVWEKRDLTV
jgi:hypothetical protein